jgi:transcriptional regulator with XRE-family HTH domain
MSVGRTIKNLRNVAGLKQKDLADRLDISPNYLSLVENDKREPSVSFLRNLASEIGIPLGLLFLDIEGDVSKASPEEIALIMRIQDLVFQLQRLKLQSEAQDDGKAQIT